MNRYKEFKIQLVDNKNGESAKNALRDYFSRNLAEMSLYRNESGRFIVWILRKNIRPALFEFKEDFIVLRNKNKDSSIPLWTKNGEFVTIDNYMTIDWLDMTDVAPVGDDINLK